jgi:hypothetical protein
VQQRFAGLVLRYVSATSCTELSLVKVHSRKSSTLESHTMKIRPLD